MSMRLTCLLLSCSVLLGCDALPGPSVSYADPAEQAKFEAALTSKGIRHTVKVLDGKRRASWDEADSPAVASIEIALFGAPLPSGRNISLEPEEQARLKARLRQKEIPFQIQYSRGREYVVWAEQDSERVRDWGIGGLPSGRNLSADPELQARFKVWLSGQGIPFSVEAFDGREFIVWAAADAARVEQWEFFPPKGALPDPSIGRTASDELRASPAAAVVKRQTSPN